MKLKEIIYNIKDSLGSDAEELSNSQYKFIIDYYRVKLIKQQIDKGNKISPIFNTVLNKINLEEVPQEDIASSYLSENVYKTAETIPSIIPYSKDRTLIYLGSGDGHLSFQETSFQALPFEAYSKYTKKLPKWFILNNKFYVINPPDEAVEHILLEAIFEDPLKAMSLNSDFNTECLRNYDFEYPISGSMLDIIYKLIRDNELKGLISEIDEDEASSR